MAKRKTVVPMIRLLGSLIIFMIIQVCCVSGVWYTLDLQARNSLSAELHIEPSWKSFEKYIETHFNIGMTRFEVLKQAEEIGPYTLDPYFLGEEYCEALYFKVGPLRTVRGGRWDICYDENEIVTWFSRYLRQ